MKINSNYSIARLFVTKEIEITIDDKQSFIIILRPIKDLFLDKDWNIAYHLWTASGEKLKQLLPFKDKEPTPYDILQIIFFTIGQYDKYRKYYDIFYKKIQELIPGIQIDLGHKELQVNGISITEEIWEYVIYLLKLSNGEKVEKPLTFDSEEAKQYYLAQKAAEERIQKIKSQKGGDVDALAKIKLSIVYAFPSFTFDYLDNQTMAQIQWLQKKAAGAMSYEVNAQAFAAGNVKKGKKLDFFIK